METNVSQIKTYLVGALLMILILLGRCTRTSAQCSVVSTNGYVVSISVNPTQIIPGSTSCMYGYNFNYKLNYNITFSGINIPSSLYTLQGNVLAPGYSANFFDLPNNGGSGTTTSGGNSYTNRTDCNTATVASFNPSIEIQIEGPGISYRTLSCPVVSLPVQLVSFTTTKAEESIVLHWATAEEKNNDYFTIETSSDAANWKALEVVNGEGNSDRLTQYSYIDKHPLNGINYYRLKQTDRNGTWAYSKIVTVDYTQQLIETSVYPNPTTSSNVTIRVATPSQEPLEAEIFNTMGQKLKSYTLTADNGFANYTIELPGTGNMFMVNVIQNNTVIGKHQVLVR